MRIAFIITGLSTGGAETMLFKLLQRIDRRRFTPGGHSGEFGTCATAIFLPQEASNPNGDEILRGWLPQRILSVVMT